MPDNDYWDDKKIPELINNALANSSSGYSRTYPGYCCWFGVTCCTGLACPSANWTSFECDCGAQGTVTRINVQRNNVKGALYDVVNALSPAACSLRRLLLQANTITGTFPEAIAALTQLRTLGLGNNNVTGSLPDTLSRMTLLEQLDVTKNSMAGQVPRNLCGNNSTYSCLVDLMIGNNQFSGQLVLPYCDSLVFMDSSNNRLSGTIVDMTGWRKMHILRTGANPNIGGPIPDTFQQAELMTDLSMPNMRLTGTIPQWFTKLVQMTILNIQNNQLTGTLPAAMFDMMASLQTLNFRNNRLNGTLPDNIQKSPITNLALINNYFWGRLPNMSSLARGNLITDLRNNHLFCCGTEYDGDNDRMHYKSIDYSAPKLPEWLVQSRIMIVQQQDNDVSDDPEWSNKLPSIGSLKCPGFMAAGTERFQLNNASNLIQFSLDPQYYMYEGCECEQGYELTQVMLESTGNVPMKLCLAVEQSFAEKYPWVIAIICIAGLLVLFWITWFSCFRRGTARPAMVQAVINMRKRVKGEPCSGSITVVNTDIEGYSDLIKEAPELMTKALNLHNAVIRKARWTNFGYTVEQEGDSYSLVFYEPLDAVMFCLMTQQALMKQQWPEGLFEGYVHNVPKKRGGSQILASIANIPSVWFHKSSKMGSNSGNLNPTLSNQPSTNGAILGSSGDSMVSRKSEGPPKGTMFYGLRVRMGVATGILQEGTAIRSSAVMEMAKVVGDAGAGGQVLMDDPTFAAIKERLEELGAVDHNGLNLKKLNSIRPPWWMCWKRGDKTQMDEAVVLDMGEYLYSSTKSLPTLVQLPSLRRDSPQGNMPLPAPSPTAGDTKEDQRLRLYQILPPSLLGRAKIFGNKLALKEEWVCVDLPYFAAPGTLEAPIGLVEGAGELPNITMVFSIVDGGKTYAKSHRKEARDIHRIIESVIRSTLRQIPGGYLCRLQDGDLKYMVAFPTAQSALSWCLVTQEALMYANWPEAVLKHDKFREERAVDGALLFRGPRLKMGICEGSPKSVLPDHLGRADYHGASINQSARYMDAGAHGGQVVLEEETAVKVLSLYEMGLAATQVNIPKAASAPVLFTANSQNQILSQLIERNVVSAEPSPANSGTMIDRHQLPLISEDEQEGTTGSLVVSGPNSNQNILMVSGKTVVDASSYSPTAVHGLGTTSPFTNIAGTSRLAQQSKAPEAGPVAEGNEPMEGPVPFAATSSGSGTETRFGKEAMAAKAATAAISSRDVMIKQPAHMYNGDEILESGDLPQSAGGSLIAPKLKVVTELSSASLGDGPHTPMHISADSIIDGAVPPAAVRVGSAPPLALLQQLPPPLLDDSLLEPLPFIRMAVSLFRTGVFRFKGNPNDINMVYATTDALSGRSFPSEPPKGKGGRVAEASGHVMTVAAMLPDVAQKYKESFYRQGAAVVIDAETKPAKSGLTSPFANMRTMSVTMSKNVTAVFQRTRSIVGGRQKQEELPSV